MIKNNTEFIKLIKMLSILKDLFNPINWIKLFKNPKKIKVLYIRLFSYPGMNFKNIKSKILRNLYKRFLINFLNFIAKKNDNLNYFFFNTDNKINYLNFSLKEIIFKLDHNKDITASAFNAFQNYGIIIIENIISEIEREKIIKVFNDFNKKDVLNLSNDQKSSDVNVKLFNSDLKDFHELLMINKKITKRIFGKEIAAQGQFLIHESINLPESIFPGDNNLHMDRYLPNIKTIYFPYEIQENLSPFMYAMGSHKINNYYKEFYLNNDECVFDDRNNRSKNFLIEKIKVVVKKNSLVIACTNGFHGRLPFEQQGKRSTLFMTYPNFDLIDLFNYLKINKINKNK